MKTVACFVLTLGLTVALAAPSYAQRQPGRGFGGGGQGGLAFLIRNEAVQKELKMEKEQVDKATEAARKVQEKHADEFTKLRDLEQDQRRAKQAELTKVVSDETLAALETILRTEQVKRLKGIELQRAGVAAFVRSDVEKALSITDDQKPKLKTIADESATKMRELQGGRGQGGGARRPGGAAPDQAKITALRKEMNEKALAVFTDDQKKTWKEMTGDAFEVPAAQRPKKDD